MFKWLFLLFLLVPIAEIYVLIEVGEVIGAGWTILFVIATAVLGAWLVKLQGLTTMQRAQESIRRGDAGGNDLIYKRFSVTDSWFCNRCGGLFIIGSGLATSSIAEINS